MRRRGDVILGLALLLLGLLASPEARAWDWPRRGPEQCERCGKVLTGDSAPVVASGWRRALPFGNRGRVCPPSAPCWSEAGAPMMAPGAAPVYPPPVAPGEPLPERVAPGRAETQPPQAPGTEPSPTQPSPTQPSTPETAAPTTPSGAESPGAQAAGLGGTLGAQGSPVLMFGDIQQFGRITAFATASQFRPPAPPEPPGVRPASSVKSASLAPSVRSFKIADNQTPFPVDRLTYSFNYFDYLSQSVNQRFNVPLDRIQGYRHVLGFEKTFWGQNASFGMRMPLNTLSALSTVPGVGRTSSAVGDLAMYTKFALWQNPETGRVLSTGLAMTVPTGPAAFGGASYLRAVHYTVLQPYLAFQYKWDRVYMIGFSAIDIPTGPHDVTMYYNDLSVGYYLFRNENRNGLIQAIAPTFEGHVNTPLNHRDPFNPRDIAGTADTVNLTEGVNILFRKRTILSIGVVNPVTGPRPFSLEALALLNVFF